MNQTAPPGFPKTGKHSPGPPNPISPNVLTPSSFKRRVDDCKARIKTQIQGDLDENPTGQALADLIHKGQKILAKEVRWLQDKAWKARRRAGERREYRNKTQNTKHPPKKDLTTNGSALGDGASTTSG